MPYVPAKRIGQAQRTVLGRCYSHSLIKRIDSLGSSVLKGPCLSPWPARN